LPVTRIDVRRGAARIQEAIRCPDFLFKRSAAWQVRLRGF
jgi:hypothetical protein